MYITNTNAVSFQELLYYYYLQKKMERPSTQHMRRSCVWWLSISRCLRDPTIQTPPLKWVSSTCWEMTAGKLHDFSLDPVQNFSLAAVTGAGGSGLKSSLFNGFLIIIIVNAVNYS